MLKASKDAHARTRQFVCGAMILFVACCLIAPLSTAETFNAGGHAETLGHRDEAPHSSQDNEIEVDIKGVKLKIPDLVVRDQDGREVRFYSDLIKDKVIVLSFFYTSCTYLCTRQGTVFSELQSLLGERLGKSVFLISVTTDPVKDNPQQLTAWGARYKVKPGWTLVTGDEAEMNKLLIRFTGNKAGGGMHVPATFIANDKKRLWTSGVGVFAPTELLKAVDSLAN